MPKIKVIELIPSLGAGGAEHFVLDLCRCLDPARFEVLLVSFFGKERSAPMYLDLIRRQPVRSLFLNKKDGLDPSVLIKLNRLFKAERPDVVHSNLYTAVYAMPVANHRGVRCCVHTVHTLAEKEMPPAYQKILARYYRRGRLIPAAISGEVRESIARRYGLPEAQIPQIDNGVDLSRFHPASPSPADKALADKTLAGKALSGPRFLCAGSLYPHKNHRLALQAFRLVRDKIPQATLAVAGDGPLRAELEQAARELGLGAAVSFLGTVERIEEVMRGCDVFVLPSDYEGFGLVVAEAMACGLPAVATRSGGPENIIRDGLDGFLVPTGDAGRLAARMLDACNPDRRPLLAARAVERARGFDLARTVSAYEQLFKAHLSP